MPPALSAQTLDSGSTPSPTLDRETYQEFLPLVRRVALRTAQSLPQGVSYDDVLRAGWSGLVDALRRRGDASKEELEPYAAYRVRLAVLEFLKNQDPQARQMRNASGRITDAIARLVAALGRIPEEKEVAGEVGLNLAGYHTLLENISAAGWVRLELTADANGLRDEESGGGIGSVHMTEVKELTGRVEGIIRALPNQYQIVLGLFYEEKCDHDEIATVLGVSQARACQLHAQAVHLIRGQLSVGGLA
jgi:RNA polymerase sigma factor FliA